MAAGNQLSQTKPREKMTIESLKQQKLILLECIAGSKAYGLDLPTSDTDTRGVFLSPKALFYGMNYVPQVSNVSNDDIYYELGRFVQLLTKNNPNMLELLAMPKDKILHQHPLLKTLEPHLFLSKKCKYTFGGYAYAQIKKARGLNKKIVNPVEKKRKTILSFCYVLYGHGSIPLEKWLNLKGFQQEHIGLVDIAHAKGIFAMFHDANRILGYKGIMIKNNATTVRLSSIPKGETVVGYLYFNQDGYIKYCKDYREYWDWVNKRNEARYQNNLEHGKNYDSKNMMHTFRLLDMAIEILETGKIIVQRPNREELLSIRKGNWSYDELIQKAEQKMEQIEIAYQKSKLPAEPAYEAIEQKLIDLRMKLY